MSRDPALKRVAFSLCLLAGVMSAGIARADLSPVDAPGVFAAHASEVPLFGKTPTWSSSTRSPHSSELGVDLSRPVFAEPLDFTSKPASTDTLVIDGPPGSLGLFLSGLLTIGAWHAGRSVGHWHPQAGWMPEWYHTGGPIQVGHAAPFDFHAGMAAVSSLDSLFASDSRPRVLVAPRDSGLVSEPSFLLCDPVRGPPL